MTVEGTIRSIWERVLGASGLRTVDNFLELGGDAVAASEMLSLVRDAYEVDIDLATFLAAPTLSQLTPLVERQMEHGLSPREVGTAPLAFSQEGMLWHEQFAPGSFNLPPLVRRYQGRLDVAALRRSLSDIVGRHAPLRTAFHVESGRPIQRVRGAHDFALPVTDLAGIDPEIVRASIGQAIAEATGRPFDLSDEPLFQPHLYRLADDDHVLVVRLHHLAFDDWSVGIFRRELSILYRAHAAGEVPMLPELRVDFAEFCRRQRCRLAGPAGTRELAYWRRELAGAPLNVPLPIGDPARPQGRPYPPAVPLNRQLPRDLVRPLRTLAGQQRSTLFMALLAVFAVVVHSYTGQDDLLLASVVANRNAADLEALIACFTKKIPIRLRLPGDATFLDVVARARNSVLGSLAHQDLAFETVIQDVLGGDAAALGVVPDISVMFQADTPHNDRLVLPGLVVGGYDTGFTARAPHFASGQGAEDDDEGRVWGGGLYRGTFLILSVVEGEDGVSLVARGAFHPPSVERILDHFEAVLAAAVAHPTDTVAQLSASTVDHRDPIGHGVGLGAGVDVRGFAVQPARIEAALSLCPGIREAAIEIRDTESSTATMVAFVIPDGSVPMPTLGEMRSYLWSRLPGYAWPAALIAVAELPHPADHGGRGADAAAVRDVAAVDSEVRRSVVPVADKEPLTSDEQALTALWADVLGGGPVRVDANYWQKFSFLEGLRRAQTGDVNPSAEQVRRNRTLQTLAADLTADPARGDHVGSASPSPECLQQSGLI
ncbi:MAG: condensation domain-containing protein [Actinomycetota bacterium]|nr:condensation domain-containing protein [Actinomycetota bacterium]